MYEHLNRQEERDLQTKRKREIKIKRRISWLRRSTTQTLKQTEGGGREREREREVT